jgi:vancomycin resistance protein YoaR
MLPFYKKPVEEKKTVHHWPLYLVAVFFILADFAVGAYFIFEEYYQNKIYPGVKLGELYLGGKTADEANEIIGNKINKINQDGVQFNYGQGNAVITPIITSFNGDIALQVINFNSDDIIAKAFSIGRGQGIYLNFKNQLRAMINGWHISNPVDVDSDQIKSLLVDNFSQFAAPAQDARLFATTTDLLGIKKIALGITSEKFGYNLDYDQGLLAMKVELEKLNNSPIELSATKGNPEIFKAQIEPLLEGGQDFLNSASLTLVYGNKKWPVPEEQFASWLTALPATGNQVVLALDKNKISDYLDKTAASQIEIPAADARFQIINGKVAQFNHSANGRKIDIDQTYQDLQNYFLADNKNIVNITVATVTSAVSDQETNNLGITELIGEGHSDFSLSPKNRIINIKAGAAALNGLLVAPGAEFSTDKSLGTVDASTGYLPEMSIMGDKTILEYGGGLCQIGTTLFRAALSSGLPITARQAHSYRVVYYEPAGTDATIYQPWPDLRFVNDTKNYILIQNHIEGNILYFDFWGTKDGRVTEQTDPTIYNITKPPPAKYTETLSLPPGQTKCTEKAHDGADAFFDYKVTYPDGAVKQKRFSSHYVPWQKVCLIGVDKLSATSTLPAIPAN